MKIDLNDIPEGFSQIQKIINNGEILTLIIPGHISVKWNKDNLHFRSSIWNSEGVLVSAGLKKFFNYEEHPEIIPHPTDKEPLDCFEKLDGSCLIVSRYKGETIIRTRGQFDTFEMPNHSEIALFKEKKKEFFDDLEAFQTVDKTYIFEWTSPENIIVVKYNEADIRLIAVIDHTEYTYLPAVAVDNIAKSYNFGRPRRFKFKNIQELLDTKEADLKQYGIEDILFEGFCIYYNNGQYIRKVKTQKYLKMHAFKEHIDIETVLEVFLVNNFSTYNEIYAYILNNYDFECCQMAQGEMSKVSNAKKEVDKIVNYMKEFVNKLTTLPSRKDQALAITQAYGITNRAGFVFKLLDKKELNSEDYKKLYWQTLKA